ncbi:type II toxin-antitoxin system mRNA interferase toxin, RelE/StbE family [Corynebacterium bovis]|uniref:type II toxin-antitoxin system RelE family toxin n=1 Tax=Corynebacterium bovis TaxID=36808 RepID=UPI000F64A96C|nr:type II toxin-antitoxin system RelE/ParE family toxin [Corynebacterium bovis]RRO97066.1 type II toxin-antitoxin system mRNA interferase toxin, RelE/StbE family [Corynebacterium bovis]
MTWQINFTPRAAKAYKKCDRRTREHISSTLRRVTHDDDPRRYGKPLVANKRGLWRWRAGHWRIIADIDDDTVTVLVVDIGHRSSVYR